MVGPGWCLIERWRFLGKLRSPIAIFNRLISFVTATICLWIARFSVRGASFSFSSNVANKSLSASRAMNNSGKYEVFCILTNWGKGGIREWNHPRPSNRCCQSVSGSANSAASWTCMVFGSSWTQAGPKFLDQISWHGFEPIGLSRPRQNLRLPLHPVSLFPEKKESVTDGTCFSSTINPCEMLHLDEDTFRSDPADGSILGPN